MKHGALAVTLLLVACADKDAGPGRSAWSALPNDHARYFSLLERNDERAVAVFGENGDTLLMIELSDATARERSKAFDRVACLSTTYFPYLSALGLTDRVKAAVDLDQVRDTAAQDRIRKGLMSELSSADGVDRERLLAAEVGIAFDYPFGKGGRSMQVLNTKVVPVTEYLEVHPLGRAEWLRFFGVLFGVERKADSLYSTIAERYTRVVVADTSNRPTVVFGSYWQGQWFVPSGNSYMARLITDAGGRYLFSDHRGAGNITLDLESMLSVAEHADHWGMVAKVDGQATVSDMTTGDDRLMRMKAVEENGLFICNTARSDFFGAAILEPDVLLQDLRWIFREPEMDTALLPRYFERIRSRP